MTLLCAPSVHWIKKKRLENRPRSAWLKFSSNWSWRSSPQGSGRHSQSCRETEFRSPAAPEKFFHRSWNANASKPAKHKECTEETRGRRAWNSFRGVPRGPKVCDGSRSWGRVDREILQWGEAKEREVKIQETSSLRYDTISAIWYDTT